MPRSFPIALIAAVSVLTSSSATLAVPFEARPPHVRQGSIMSDPTFVGALSDLRLREIVADIKAGRSNQAKKKLVVFLKAVPGSVPAIEILGTLLQNEGKYAQAERLLRQAATAAPQQVSVRLRLAVALLNQQKFTEAAPHLQFAIEQEPNNVLALTNYGWLLAVLDRNAQALQVYERLAQKEFEGKIAKTDLFVGLAILYFRLEHHDRAIKLLEPEFARAKEPNINNRIFLNLFNAYLSMGKKDEATRVLDKLEKLIPATHPGVMLARANLMGTNGDLAGATKLLQKGLKSYPDAHADIHLAIAHMNIDRKYFRQARDAFASAAQAAAAVNRIGILSEMTQTFSKVERRQDATPVLERFATTNGNDPSIALLLAENLGQTRQPKEALAILEQLVAADPKLARAHFLKAIILRGQKKVADARVAMRKSVTLEPGNPAAWNLLSDLAHDMSGDAEMVKVMKEGLGHNPTDPNLLLGVGSLSYSQGDIAYAEDIFKRMVSRFPNNPIALSNAALAALDLGRDVEEPQQLLERALKIAPRVPAIVDTWGWMLHKSGKSAAAIDLLLRVAKAIPKDGGVQYHLGVAYSESGKTGLGRAALRRALAIGVPIHYRKDIIARLSAK